MGISLTSTHARAIQKTFFFLTLPLSVIYFLLIWINRFLGSKSARSLGSKTLSVGNLYVGGTGKTPTVIALVDFLKTEGYEVVVLSRGYKSGLDKHTFGLYKNKKLLLSYPTQSDSCGADEAKLIHDSTGVDSLFGTQRHRAVEWYLRSHEPPDIWILDDGFQHHKIKRDLDILLFDYNLDLRKEFLLPFGFLREPLFFAKFSDFIGFTKGKNALDQPDWAAELFLDKPKYIIHQNDLGLFELAPDGLPKEAEISNNQKCVFVSGIADPENVLRELKSQNIIVEANYFVGDHAQFDEKKLAELGKIYHVVITTEKDVARSSDLFHRCFDKVVIKRIKYTFCEKFKKDLLNKLKHLKPARKS